MKAAGSLEKIRALREKAALEGPGRMLGLGWRTLCFALAKGVLRRRHLVRQIHGYSMILNIGARGIAKTLAIYGEHERLETQLVRERLGPGKVAIDVGANIGYYALLEATLVGQEGLVYALEPFPRNYGLLVRNIRLNGLQDRIRSFPLAAGNGNGTSNMYLGRSDNMHCLMAYDREDAYKESIEVETVTLDRFLEDKRRIDFLRMDLEGFECQVLEGMGKTLERDRPDLFFEVHPVGDIDPDPRYTPCLERLLSLGYRPETLICPAHGRALATFRSLGYQPDRVVYSGMVRSARFDGIRPDDLIKVAARRPKITRAIYWRAGSRG